MQYVSGEWVEAPVVQQAKPVVQPERKMVAVLPFIEKEMEQVKGFLQRSCQLSGQIPRTIYLLPFKGLDTKDIWAAAEAAFTNVSTILDSEGLNSDWQGQGKLRSAAGPNSFFRQATWHFYLKKVGPWLWLEPDCWPISDRWFYDIEREYFDAGKPFMGAKMAVGNGREYMNGVAVYPYNAVQYAQSLIQQTTWQQHPEMEVGFDVAGGAEVLGKAHITGKIQLMGPLAKGNANVRPATVLCHGRIDLSGGSNAGQPSNTECGVKKSEMGTDQRTNPSPAQKPFLDRYGTAGDPQTKVFGDVSSHAAPRVPLHETPVQESPYKTIIDKYYGEYVEWKKDETPVQETPSQSKNGGSEYGRLSQDIKGTVQFLVKLWNNQPHRKVLIVKELRKAKLVPKHFR